MLFGYLTRLRDKEIGKYRLETLSVKITKGTNIKLVQRASIFLIHLEVFGKSK